MLNQLRMLGTCALCKQPDRPLLNSHIIPEFMVKGATEWLPKGRSGQLQPYLDVINYETLKSTKTGIKKHVLYSEGVIQRLLCAGCEAHLQKGEAYVRTVLYGDGPTMIHTKPVRSKRIYKTTSEGWTSVVGVEKRFVDYALFKQFQIGVLWRCAAASGSVFQKLQIDGAIREELRVSLLEPIPPARLAPCYMEKMIGLEPVWIECLGLPQTANNSFEIIMGGYRWFYRLAENWQDTLFLSEDGRLYNTITNVDLHEQYRSAKLK